jgi:hypothetical protein
MLQVRATGTDARITTIIRVLSWKPLSNNMTATNGAYLLIP